MGADFSPVMREYNGLRPFRFWCQKVLPLVYDDSLSYYELLCKVVNYINNLIEDGQKVGENIDALLSAYNELQEYVNNYFDNLDLQDEVDNKLDEMTETGVLSQLLSNNYSIFPTIFGVSQGTIVHSNDYLPSSFGRVNNILYILSSPTTNLGTENGIITKINLTTNKIIATYENKYMCHANSCATVNNEGIINHYVCPAHLNTGVTDIVNGLIKYDENFENYTVVADEYNYLGVSFDSVTNKLYAYERVSRNLYEIDYKNGDEVIYIGKIEIPKDANNNYDVSEYNQDIAVYNNWLYLSGYKNQFIKVYIPTLETEMYGFVSHVDGANKYVFDELEGWEFDSEGKLFCVMFSKIRRVISCGIYTQICFPNKPVIYPPSVIANPGETVFITDDSITNFANNEAYFKHPSEAALTTHEFGYWNIQTTHNFGKVSVAKNKMVNHSLVCDELQVYCDYLCFSPVDLNQTVNIGKIVCTNRGGNVVLERDGFTYYIGDWYFQYAKTNVHVAKNVTLVPNNIGQLVTANTSPASFDTLSDNVRPFAYRYGYTPTVTILPNSFSESLTVDVKLPMVGAYSTIISSTSYAIPFSSYYTRVSNSTEPIYRVTYRLYNPNSTNTVNPAISIAFIPRADLT